jgi:predicted outer membrane protein
MMLMAGMVLPLLAGCAAAPHQGASYDREVSPAGFTADALHDRAMEQAMAQLALDRAESPDVHHYASKVLADAKNDDTALQALAQQNNVAYPSHLTPQDRGDLNTLRSLARGEFDRYYTDFATRDERKTLTLYTLAAQSGTPGVAQYAEAGKPKLLEHFTIANQLYAQTSGNSYPEFAG